MTSAGFYILGDTADHAISPVHVDDNYALQFVAELLELGVQGTAVGDPACPVGEARIRVAMNASLSQEDVDMVIEAFIKVGKKLGYPK